MTLTELPNDIDTLKRLVLDTHRQVVDRDERIAERDERLAEQEEELKSLQSQLAYLKHKLFGRRSEKIDPAQLLLFKELQARVDELQEKVEQEEITYRRRKGHGRRPLPDDLPAEDVVYPPRARIAPAAGSRCIRSAARSPKSWTTTRGACSSAGTSVPSMPAANARKVFTSPRCPRVRSTRGSRVPDCWPTC